MVMRDFVLSLCAAAILIAALRLLAPNGRFEKTLQYAMALFLMLSIISAVLKVDFSLPEFEAEKIETTGESELNLAVLKGAITELLLDYGVEVQEIYFNTDILKDGGISITKVTVKTDQAEDAQKIREIIKSQTGLLAEVE